MKRIVFATAIFTFSIAVPGLAQRGGKPAGTPAPAHTTTTTAHGASAHATATTTATPGPSAHTTTSHPSHTTTTTTTASIPPHLASKLQSRLPAGTNLQTARTGFRNLGQFVAAVNVSNNLGIPFAQLKTRMVEQHMSLGQAIQDARPSTTDATTVAGRAERDADTQIRASKKTTTTTTHK